MSDWLARIAGIRGVREVEVEQTQTTRVRVEASEPSEYEQLAVHYLEMARGITGDPIKGCSPAGWATLALLEQLRYQS
jgi:hypothetical protein